MSLSIREKFLLIRKEFIRLLELQNNSYKYVTYYIQKMNKYIEAEDESGIWKYKHSISACDEIDATILEQLLYMLTVIYEEKGKTRYHSNDEIASKIEKPIVVDAMKILKDDKYKYEKIREINEVVTKEIDESYFDIYKSKYGYKTSVNSDAIAEITDETVTDIYTNFHQIKILLEPTEKLNEKHKQVDNYLFCLYYFNKPL
jgi:hypothetical protein